MNAHHGRYAMVPVKALQAGAVTPTAFRVLYALRKRYRPGSATFAATRAICDELSITTQVYRRAMRQLGSAGLVTVQHAAVDGRVNTYQFPETKGKGKGFVGIPVALLDRGLSANGIKVYGMLRSYCRDRQGASCHPRVETVCEKFGVGKRTFLRGLAELTDAGVVTVSKNFNGRIRTNEYTFPVLDEVPKPAPICTDDITKTEPISAAGEQELAPRGEQNWHLVDADFGTSYKEVETVEVKNVEVETVELPSAGTSRESRSHSSKGIEGKAKQTVTMPGQEQSDGFWDFWAAMPKRTGSRARAQAAFNKLVQSGEATADDLIRCAKRYAERVQGENHQHVCFPANWLQDGKWRQYELGEYFTPWNEKRTEVKWRLEQKREAAAKSRVWW